MTVMTDTLVKLCPICKKTNVPPAHIMGHMGKGKKKMFKPDHLMFLSRHMRRVNQNRLAGLKLTGKRP